MLLHDDLLQFIQSKPYQHDLLLYITRVHKGPESPFPLVVELEFFANINHWIYGILNQLPDSKLVSLSALYDHFDHCRTMSYAEAYNHFSDPNFI
jgi:hypothetical protein